VIFLLVGRNIIQENVFITSTLAKERAQYPIGEYLEVVWANLCVEIG
jgi:hypothetical protein